jgi:hypothetical protein
MKEKQSKIARLGRRGFLKAGLLSSGIAVAAAGQPQSPVRQGDGKGDEVFGPRSDHGGSHGAAGTVGSVNNQANGFDPHELLNDWDYGEASPDEFRDQRCGRSKATVFASSSQTAAAIRTPFTFTESIPLRRTACPEQAMV